MAIDFTPQFHRRISGNCKQGVWVALPHPKTLLPIKKKYYREWQHEEYLRLLQTGEDVLAFAVSH